MTFLVATTAAFACVHDADCGCDGTTRCVAGACTAAFTLSAFPIGTSGAGPYTTPVIAVADHAGGFYTGCCDTAIVAFSGERAERGMDAVLCPALPDFPACLFAPCLCGYARSDGAPFVVTGSYVGVVGPSHLQYDGHAGWDYEADAGTPLVAARAGSLCKAVADPVAGTAGQPTAWDGFHTFYVDHGSVAGAGWSSWYFHATDLTGSALDGRSLADLAPGECAPVAAGQLVATAGATGTFVSHLHFELRRYVPGDGPEAATAKVVDPYGWRGADPDPWSLPGGNPQAASVAEPAWRACGNGRVECGEACDGDACCRSDCTRAVPRTDCRRSTVFGGARLTMRAAANGKPARLGWRLGRGAATTAAELGDPASDAAYELCVFDATTPSPAVLFGARAPAGGMCPATSTTPCWKVSGTPPGSRGVRYRQPDGSPDGIETLQLRPGPAGKTKVALGARGPALAFPALPVTLPLRVQLATENGTCFEASYGADGVRRNDAERLDVAGE